VATRRRAVGSDSRVTVSRRYHRPLFETGGFIVYRRIVVLAALLSSLSAFAADVAGTWKLTVKMSAGTGTPTLVLQQDGENLTGTYTGRFGASPIKGTLKGNAIEFSFTVTGPMGGSGDVTYQGTVDGASMSGTVNLGPMGDGTFTGTKQ
jgi:hypothetical protein